MKEKISLGLFSQSLEVGTNILWLVQSKVCPASQSMKKRNVALYSVYDMVAFQMSTCFSKLVLNSLLDSNYQARTSQVTSTNIQRRDPAHQKIAATIIIVLVYITNYR